MEYQRLPGSRGREIRWHLRELRGFYNGGNPAGETGQRLLLQVFESEDGVQRPFLKTYNKIIAIIY